MARPGGAEGGGAYFDYDKKTSKENDRFAQGIVVGFIIALVFAFVVAGIVLGN